MSVNTDTPAHLLCLRSTSLAALRSPRSDGCIAGCGSRRCAYLSMIRSHEGSNGTQRNQRMAGMSQREIIDITGTRRPIVAVAVPPVVAFHGRDLVTATTLFRFAANVGAHRELAEAAVGLQRNGGAFARRV